MGEQCWDRMKGKEETGRGQKWNVHSNNQEEPLISGIGELPTLMVMRRDDFIDP